LNSQIKLGLVAGCINPKVRDLSVVARKALVSRSQAERNGITSRQLRIGVPHEAGLPRNTVTVAIIDTTNTSNEKEKAAQLEDLEHHYKEQKGKSTTKKKSRMKIMKSFYILLVVVGKRETIFSTVDSVCTN
jgi:hypothetical protein